MSGMGAQFLAKHKQLQETNDSLRDEVVQLKDEIKLLKEQNQEQERQISELSQGKELLGSDIERVRGQLGEAKEALDAGAQDNAKLKALESRVELLQAELDETFVAAQAANKSRQEAELTAEHFERQAKSAESQAKVWETKHDEISQKYSDLQAEMKELENTLNSL
ncbi:tropomyosin-2 [Ophidiomyces ophidiicola]|uniref:Tropomyosin-2 n=1 Tax=Ophidiomyces ophidiicola TaxID=1387563 RepID=A0ACB8UZY1_9EURO|nr:tropomyosin-2 [Ophidiomyces ophidiicola]KAI1909269.1 tropomyosin-2 [Ophidiomyces ophidiicola]KAI1913174.1 tropomyosin-2 [Ophidiomyces ophidiicola]KAI1920733.1 tropomyosin-2 [Ophidiomyces ophidiicola]KAI1928586.1 tropomyosin-2 [Ophidiomyces ophidiicola]KAI1934682.1 tropomyosin-2 [Ophidiomyces ophidiicola]